MSKINPNTDAASQAAKTQASKSRKPGQAHMVRTTGSADFSKLLQDQLAPPADATSQTATSPGGLAELDELQTVSRVTFELNTLSSGITEELAASIDLLDAYAQTLADPGKTLRQAFDLLEQIESKTQGMTGTLTQDINAEDINAQDMDTGLKDILDHLSTLVAVEKVKLNRGDYL